MATVDKSELENEVMIAHSEEPTRLVVCPACKALHQAKNIYEDIVDVYSGGSANTSQGTGNWFCPSCQ